MAPKMAHDKPEIRIQYLQGEQTTTQFEIGFQKALLSLSFQGDLKELASPLQNQVQIISGLFWTFRTILKAVRNFSNILMISDCEFGMSCMYFVPKKNQVTLVSVCTAQFKVWLWCQYQSSVERDVKQKSTPNAIKFSLCVVQLL